jgi:hypothetical protein
MPRTLLLIGTRKGAFVLESDAARRDWALRGPYCEGWPVYHAVYDTGSGSIYAAAASDWHGSAVWRSRDLGESWELSSEGLGYGDDGGRKLSKVSTLAVSGDRVLAGVESPGIFESRDGGETWSLLSTLAGQPGSEIWDDPANQPPGHLGISGFVTDGADADRFWAVVQGIGAFETADGGTTWTPRNRGLRADWPRPHEEVGFCVHKLVRSPSDGTRMYQQNHVGMHRSDDEGHTWNEITEVMPDGKPAVWRTGDGGSSWRALTAGLPQQGAHLGVLRQAMAIDSMDVPGVYFGTSTGQVFASADEGETWAQIADYLPAISSVEVAVVE